MCDNECGSYDLIICPVLVIESCAKVWAPLLKLCACVFQVSVEQLPPQVDQESLDIDDFLDNSMTGSSFLMFNGIPTEVGPLSPA